MVMTSGEESRLLSGKGNDLSMPIVGCRFNNPWQGWRFPSVLHIIYLFIRSLFYREPRMLSRAELDKSLPVLKPNFSGDQPEDEVRATWLGHASVLFQLDGVRVLCDPVFSDYCSPVRGFGPKRYRPPPCSVDELPELDAVVISHTHYDHLDRQSVLDLNRRFPDVAWFVPLGCARWMRDCGCERVTEMTWWDEAEVPSRPGVKVAFTPTQHWSGRGLFDRNKCLWGSWAVIGPLHRVWFAGDTGYCEAFKEVGRQYGPFDLAAIPIGAYCPRWFMNPQHVDPQRAVDIHRDVNSKLSVGIHWGTFVMTLSTEPLLEPRHELRRAMDEQGLRADAFITIEHGQTLAFEPESGAQRLV